MEQLTYRPVTYLRRETFWRRALGIGSAVAGASVLFDQYLATRPVHPALIVFQILICLVFAYATVKGLSGENTYECRVEGDQLVLITPKKQWSIAIAQIVEIVEVIEVKGGWTAGPRFEITVCDLGILGAEPFAISPVEPLFAELHKINEQIRFSKRPSDRCLSCRKKIWPMGLPFAAGESPRFVCGWCGAEFPRRGEFVQPVKPSVR